MLVRLLDACWLYLRAQVMPVLAMDAASAFFFDADTTANVTVSAAAEHPVLTDTASPQATPSPSSLSHAGQQHYSLVSRIASADQGDMSVYCATIILQAALVSCAYQLTRLHEVLCGRVLCWLAVTPAERQQALLPWEHE